MNVYNIKNRLAICGTCPIFNNGRCNASLWLNPDTNEVSIYKRPGYVRGCNCIIEIKAKNPNNHCVAGKW